MILLNKDEKILRNKLAEEANKEINPWKIYKIKYKVPGGGMYEARYHRSQYFYDNEPVTFENTNRLKNTYHIDYWKCFENGGAVEIAPNNIYCMVYSENKEELKTLIRNWLEILANINNDAIKKVKH